MFVPYIIWELLLSLQIMRCSAIQNEYVSTLSYLQYNTNDTLVRQVMVAIVTEMLMNLLTKVKI